MISEIIEQNLTELQPIKQSKKALSKNVVPQKRKVIAVKVFVTPEEKNELENSIGEFNSLSNFIRHRLGLPANNTGRPKTKNQKTKLFDFDETEIENMLDSIFS